jgi:hypothetical protein
MSQRGMTSGALAQAAAQVKSVCQMAEFDFSGATVYLCNHTRNLVYGVHTYTAVGGLGQATNVHESAAVVSNPMSFSMSGVNTSDIAIALTQNYIGRTCKLFLVFLDANDAMVSDPVLMFEGLMDTMPIEIGEKFATITITAESIFRRWETPKTRRVNDADQQKLYPGDLGLQYVAEMVNKTLVWGNHA